MYYRDKWDTLADVMMCIAAAGWGSLITVFILR